MLGLDALHRFSDEQSLVAGAVASTNVYDDEQDRNLGIGEPLGVAVFVTTAAAVQTGSGTFTFELQTDDNENFNSAQLICSRVIPGSKLTSGSIHILPLPHDPDSERYLRMNYDLAGNSPTLGVSAYLVPMKSVHAWVTYESPVSIQ